MPATDSSNSPSPSRLPPTEPPRRTYLEVTVSAMVLAIFIGVIMNAAITYAGLKIGFTLGGSSIAAVLGFGILRGIFRRGSILEINIVQTVASGVNVPNSGVIFTVPVLFLMGFALPVNGADFWLIMLACIGGSLLGTAFIIPLRKQMIEIERLRFPSPTAVAAILKSPGAGPAKAVVLLVGIVVGAISFVPTELHNLLAKPSWSLQNLPGVGEAHGGFVGRNTINAGKWMGLPPQIQLVFAIAPFALGAGYLTGRAGLFVLAGGVLAYFLINPLAYALGWMPETTTAAQAPAYAFAAFNRPLGIGLLLGGALMGIVCSLPAIATVFKSIFAAKARKGDRAELGAGTLIIAIAFGLVFLFIAANVIGTRPINLNDPVTGAHIESVATTVQHSGYTIGFGSEQSAQEWAQWDDTKREAFLTTLHAKPGLLAGVSPVIRAAVIAVFGAVWIWFAGIIIAQCAGMTDWSPISGLALLTVVMVLLLAGTGAVMGAVLIGAALCVAITLASDMMGDLKTGHLVGAVPRRQQITELATVAIGPVVCMFTLALIAEVNLREHGMAMGPGTPTVAPQAQALQAVITGVQGGQMPYAMYGMGGLLGVLLGLGAFPGLGVLVGLSMYLPFTYIATYGIGCLTQMTVARIKGRTWAEDWGVPFCAGLIVGESVLALVFNLIILARGS